MKSTDPILWAAVLLTGVLAVVGFFLSREGPDPGATPQPVGEQGEARRSVGLGIGGDGTEPTRSLPERRGASRALAGGAGETETGDQPAGRSRDALAGSARVHEGAAGRPRPTGPPKRPLPGGSGHILFQVEDGSGKPLPGARVILGAADHPDAVGEGVAGSDGQARFDRPPRWPRISMSC